MVVRIVRGTAAAALCLAAWFGPVQAETRTIGYSVATLANPFFQGMTQGVKDGIAAHPDLKLINTSANGDATTQANQTLDLINQGVRP